MGPFIAFWSFNFHDRIRLAVWLMLGSWITCLLIHAIYCWNKWCIQRVKLNNTIESNKRDGSGDDNCTASDDSADAESYTTCFDELYSTLEDVEAAVQAANARSDIVCVQMELE